MIGSLRGILVDRLLPGEVIIDVGGVGYRASVPSSILSSLGPDGSEVFLHVHTHVREDAIVLFGFAQASERRCFEALLGAHGIGPSLALAILSSLSPASLSKAVLEDDIDTLCLIPGVGKRTAARLLLELKERLDLPTWEVDSAIVPGGERSARGEVRAALVELGYGPDEIRKALDAIPDNGSAETMVRAALRELVRSR